MDAEKIKSWYQQNKAVLLNLIAIGFPMVIQGIVFELQSLTDKAFLGKLGDTYIAVVGATQFPVGTTVAFLTALCTGVTIVVSQLYGAGKKDQILANVKSAVFFNTLLGILFFCLWFFLGGVVMRLLSVDEILMEDCISCLKVYAFFFLFLGIDSSLQAMLQGLGNTKPILYAGLLKVGINILLSWILIFGKFGMPELKVYGAAIGTMVANILSTIVLILYCFVIKNKEYHLLQENKLWFDLKTYKKSLVLGIPTAMEYLMWHLSNLVLIRFLNGFSYVATTIYTLTFGIEVIVVAIFSGNSKASMALMGHSIGAEDSRQANRIFYTCIVFNLMIVILFAILFFTIPEPILSIFCKEETILKNGIPFMVFTGFILIPKSMNVMVGSGIRAYSDTKWMFYSQIIGSVLVVSLSFVLVSVVGMGIEAIYITLFSDEFVRSSLNFWHFQKNYSNKAQERRKEKGCISCGKV